MAHGRAWRLSAALALVCLAIPFGPARSAAAAEPLTLVSQQTVTLPVAVPPRTATDYTFQTSALASPTTVRVLLPRDYATSGKRYPVLYLLHGGAANYRSWSSEGGIVQAQTDGLDLIVVMPDAGRSAWYTDWYNNGSGGRPAWETFHIDQLIPWVDTNLRTVASRSGRAIIGLSSGGFGAMSYASRNPDQFVAAAAFSGAVDTNTPPVIAGKVIDGLAAQDGGVPGSLFGLRETQEVRWRGHNPWDLATNLREMDLTLRYGNAFPGGGGAEPPWDFGGRFLERATYEMSVSFHRRLDTLQIPHVNEDYGPGSHNFYYWNRDLERTLPGLMQVFAEQRPDPSPFSYTSIEPSYDIYGWNVAMQRPAVEFSSFEDVDADGFRLRGSGSAAVTSPAIYEPGATYNVSVGSDAQVLTASNDGRLVIAVPLGAGNLVQQYYVNGTSPATTVNTTEVSIELAQPADAVAPTVAISSPEDGGTYVLGEPATASYACSDEGSGVDTCDGSLDDGATLDTSEVGQRTFAVTATDRAGNTTTQTVAYSVVYDTEAFLHPIEPAPGTNRGVPNQGVPFKWRLRDAAGNQDASLEPADVTFAWIAIDCETHAASGEHTDVPSDGLAYDLDGGHYVLTAKMPAGTSGTCQRFAMYLDDGTQHAADFAVR